MNILLTPECKQLLKGISINLKNIQTNIIHYNVKNLGITSKQFISKLKEYGILTLSRDKYDVRMVTHRGIEKEHVNKTLNIIENTIKKL